MEKATEIAAHVAAVAAPLAEAHDREGSFAAEGVGAARDSGYLAMPVPTELGGGGATAAEIAAAQRVLARACGSTALACSMHLHVVTAAAWRLRRGETVVEPMLRRVSYDRAVITSTGGNDWTRPTTVATPDDGGWRVSGRKTFASISPAADLAATFAVVGEPRPGAPVIGFGLPLKAEGVHIEETWDAAGMRATGSHDLVLDDVFVDERQVSVWRRWGELDRPLVVAGIFAIPIIYSTYLGIAEALVDAVLDSGKVRASAARQAGLLDNLVRLARWSIDAVNAELGDDPEPTMDNFMATQHMKRHVTVACQEIAAVAAEVAGGGAYARRGPVDRMIRDLRAALYHPYTGEVALVHAGLHRLGLPDEDW